MVLEAKFDNGLVTPAEFSATTVKYQVPEVRFSTTYEFTEGFFNVTD
jgi:hypothetical protein